MPSSSTCQILQQPVTTLKGIGGQTARRLQRLGIVRIVDLLLHLPLRYEDRTRVCPIGALQPGMTALICGRIEFSEVLQRGRRSLVCRMSDATGCITLRFFHFTARQRSDLQNAPLLSCFAEVRSGYAGLEMIHPEYKLLPSSSACPTEFCLTPVYSLCEGLHQKTIRKLVQQALSLFTRNQDALPELLPDALLQTLHFPGLAKAITLLHSPDGSVALDELEGGRHPTIKRLAFEEFLAHHLSLRIARLQDQALQAPVFESDQQLSDAFKRNLAFHLTPAQLRVIEEISSDCRSDRPMMRLLQGDVGSGKTVVSAFATLQALSSGYQVAVMAPTELLAEQHYNSYRAWFEPLQINTVCLSGQQKKTRREAILQDIATGSAGVIVGTHALFQEAVRFFRLGLLIIDEQHRFGVNQRLALRAKGEASGCRPHQLVMTATPIPRTLAMLRYADLDISVIDEMPPGRQNVVTSAIPAERRAEVIARIDSWIARGRQAYWVCTLIEESEALQCQAAENTLAQLTQALPEIRFALVHGRMKASEKEQAMQAFKEGSTDLLVATTVIEVGVDVPNAGLMIIENPERLGLAQLHQLRGRVGRGPGDSYCLLMYQGPLSETARQRLGILRETCNGFVIAEKDLQLRGPGEMLGTRQTGQIQFKIANLGRDAELIPMVQQAAEIIQTEAPEAIQPLIDRWLGDTNQYAEV